MVWNALEKRVRELEKAWLPSESGFTDQEFQWFRYWMEQAEVEAGRDPPDRWGMPHSTPPPPHIEELMWKRYDEASRRHDERRSGPTRGGKKSRGSG